MLAPAVIALTVLVLSTIPLWLLAAAVLSPVVPGRLRPLRLLWLLLLHLVLESLMLLELFGLWIASGFGHWIRRPYFERIHYDIVQAYLVFFFREARRVAAAADRHRGPGPGRATRGSRCWCAAATPGPADSFTLMYALMHWYGREPRVVLKDTLAWDPAIDVILNRLPSRFVSPGGSGGDDLERQVGELARNLDENDAFVIFPEGGNFTPERRQRQIDKLRRLGRESMARRAERMENVLAPRPGGLLAALDAAPDADVVLVAHTGLDHLATVARHLAGAADGQADHHAVVAGAPRRDPGGARRADRLAVLVVGADRRLGRGAQTRRPAAPQTGATGLLTVSCEAVASAACRRRSRSAGLSGVLASCGTSAASEAASVGSDAAASSDAASARSGTGPGHRTAGGRRDAARVAGCTTTASWSWAAGARAA